MLVHLFSHTHTEEGGKRIRQYLGVFFIVQKYRISLYYVTTYIMLD